MDDTKHESDEEYLLRCRTAADIEKARELPLTACPRRYCWWWKTLSFDWDSIPSDGCEFQARISRCPDEYRSGWANHKLPCCRADESSNADHYEPREPHLEEDGFDRYRFLSPEDWRTEARPDAFVSGRGNKKRQ